MFFKKNKLFFFLCLVMIFTLSVSMPVLAQDEDEDEAVEKAPEKKEEKAPQVSEKEQQLRQTLMSSKYDNESPGMPPLETQSREDFPPPAYIPGPDSFTDEKHPVFKVRRDNTASSKNKFNSFNRLLKWDHTPPWAHPTEDGLHDSTMDSTQNEILPPELGMSNLYPDKFGNMVNWVTAMGVPSVAMPDVPNPEQQITPLERIGLEFEEMGFFDLEVEIPAVGLINNVIFPHAPHTVWLACSNCHEAQSFPEPIFNPEEGSNPITMRAIVEGRFCGVCHSGRLEKVAFPLADCKRCHSGPDKTEPTGMKDYMLEQLKNQ